VDDLLALQPEHVQRHPDEQHVDESPRDGTVLQVRKRLDESREQSLGLVELEDQRVLLRDRRPEHQPLGGLNEALGDLDVTGENGRLPVALVDQTHGRGIDDRGQNAVGVAGFEAPLVDPALR